MLRATIVSMVLILFLSSSTWASVKTDGYILTPMIGGQVFDSEQNLDDGRLWSIGLGYNLNERATLEAVYSRTEADGDSNADDDVDQSAIRIDALYHFRPQHVFNPYFAAGIGRLYLNPEHGHNRQDSFINAGGGFTLSFNDRIALRTDLRYLFNSSQTLHNFLYAAGFVFQFGYPATAQEPLVEKTQAVQQMPAPLAPQNPPDSDDDGIVDAMDRCPETPSDVAVDQNGCPADEDLDGVWDYLDLCPQTPQGVHVNVHGCPIDSDEDTVPDQEDRCPETPAGVVVDEHGCPRSLTLRINFNTNSAQFDSTFDSEIAKAARCIDAFAGNQVYIDGHTDSQGAETYNFDLSLRRARAVKQRLVEKFKIPAERLIPRGFGETEPLTDNITREGRHQNRRVEVACGVEE